MCCTLPKHLNFPLTMIASLVQSASASSIECDVKMIDRPDCSQTANKKNIQASKQSKQSKRSK
eukprot:m.261346 g.261346  ORF g.261346 m.261346 type:complete len:63 (-) comp54608_c0_seq1:14-202(-)